MMSIRHGEQNQIAKDQENCNENEEMNEWLTEWAKKKATIALSFVLFLLFAIYCRNIENTDK